MSILITGHKGFIGKSLSQNFENFIGMDGEYSKIEIEEKLNKIKPKVIFHVGACADTLNEDVNYMIKQNYLSTKWIVDWCVKNKCKIIYSSSASVYGIDGKYPSNLYGWTKYLSDEYVVKNGGISLRYFNVYGPGEEHKGKMSSMIYQNYNKSKVFLFPKKPKRDFVYIDDVVKSNIYAFKNYESLKGKSYEVGSGKSFSFETIFNILDIEIDYLPIESIPDSYQFNTCSKKEKWMNGWEPEYSLERGIKKYKKYLNEES